MCSMYYDIEQKIKELTITGNKNKLKGGRQLGNWDSIFQKIQKRVADVCQNVTQTYEVTPNNLPVLLVDCRGEITRDDAFDMEDGSTASDLVMELTAYTSGAEKLKDARAIMALADEEMRTLYFKRTDGPKQITEIEDSTICRYTARYERIVTENELL